MTAVALQRFFVVCYPTSVNTEKYLKLQKIGFFAITIIPLALLGAELGYIINNVWIPMKLIVPSIFSSISLILLFLSITKIKL